LLPEGFLSWFGVLIITRSVQKTSVTSILKCSPPRGGHTGNIRAPSGPPPPLTRKECLPRSGRNAAAEKEKGCRQAGGATAHGKKSPETAFSFLYGPNMTNAGLPHRISNFMVYLSTNEFASFFLSPAPCIRRGLQPRRMPFLPDGRGFFRPPAVPFPLPETRRVK